MIEGLLKVTAEAPSQRERILAIRGPGALVGELTLIDGAPRSATVTAVGDLVTLRIARPAFLELLKNEPTIAVGLLRGLVALFREVELAEAG